MKMFVTGGAGFIGSNLVDRLIEDGHQVTVYDNLSSGKRDFIKHHLTASKDISGVSNIDLLDLHHLGHAMKGRIIHPNRAANNGISPSTSKPSVNAPITSKPSFDVPQSP